MGKTKKQLSNPFSTGSGGVNFETHVQAAFVVLMLAGGFVPCSPGCVIRRIKLQGRYAGYETDDLIVFTEKQGDGQGRKLLGQIKHSVSITPGDVVFGEVIQAAWNDFNNPKVFTRGKDSIALITGPLSAIDSNEVREILEWARSCENSGEFFTKVGLTNFSSAVKQRKLTAFQSQLKKANGTREVPDEETFQFLRHFHLLGYDLDIKAGVTLSLLHSLIGQYSRSEAQNIWARIIAEVQSANQNAGTITIVSLPDDIQTAFQRPYAKTMPPTLAVMPSQAIDWSQIKYASDLAVANLVGSWNEASQADKEIVSKLAKEDFDKWVPKIQEILQQPGSPVNLKNGVWSVPQRKELWQAVGQRLFDSHLDLFKEYVVAVLKEPDPRFELPPEERYAAGAHGKVLKHSQYLRRGLAESLALLGSFPTMLSNCSTGKPQTIDLLSVREIFDNSDSVLWGSLNDLLPLLAEASPNEFLNAVEAALEKTPCPFDELFAQEGKGILGENYLTGLLWALETLAWDEEHLVRVSMVLGELASHDPGGQWANRPSNSLTTIFLPWFPQTMAPVEKRKVAVQTLQRENPTAAWKLLLSLLPNPIQHSSGASKPKWRMSIPEDWPKVTQKEYWDQVTMYADMIVDLAEHDIAKLAEITSHLDDFPQQILEKVLEHLSTIDITTKPENERMPLWAGLTELVSKHERFADAKWALSPEFVSKIKETAKKLAPQARGNLYKRLFSEREMDILEEKGNREEQFRKLEERRQSAIKEIFNEGSDAILRFADTVESPWKVGISTGFVANPEMDSVVLPRLLESENKNLVQLACGFVCSRYANRGWVWVDGLDKNGWTPSQTGRFLSNLPFTEDTWKRVKELLGGDEAEYWNRVSINEYQVKSDLYIAVDKLLEFRRPSSAIRCLYRILDEKQTLDKARTFNALLLALSTTEPVNSMDGYYIVEIIKALQNDSTTSLDDLARIEWAYLQLLERDHRGASPKTLENRLASNPGFFCEVIQFVYRSKKEPKTEKKYSEQEKTIAKHAYQLLHEWRTPPGTQPAGGFSKEHLFDWLASVKGLCMESGHLEVALQHVGNVLIHCPPDPDGFWINRGAAEALNGKDAEEIRHGFAIAIFNSRGVHTVDPSGKPEMELSAKYKRQADDAENAGYQRLAIAMRGLADSYANEAKRVIDEAKQERDDGEP